MSWVNLAIAGGTAIYGAVSSNQKAKQAQGLAGQAARASQVDIEKLNEQVKNQAAGNLAASRALEAQYDPQNQQLRSETVQHLLSFLNAGQGQQGFQAQLAQSNPLLASAYSMAQGDLTKPGMLPQDVVNELTRHSLSVAGGVNPGGSLGLGRDLAARDLGLNSLQLRNQQLTNAGNIAGQADSSVGAGFNRLLSAASFGQSIQPPQAGLSPSSVANIAIGNQNAQGSAYANQANVAGNQANGYLQLAGAAAGYGLGNYFGKPANTPQSALNATPS